MGAFGSMTKLPDWLGGKRIMGKGGVELTEVVDPLKQAVASPLSAFLANQVGKGLPRYTETTGQPLTAELDPSAYSTYQNFLSVSPSEWYTKGVEEPTLKAMREEIPLIEEGWAGGLRGSGRFRDVEDYMQDTATTLAEGRYQAELQIPQAQFEMAGKYKGMQDVDYAKNYADWYQSLPENNPVLGQAMSFLGGPTGTDVLARYELPMWEKIMSWIIQGAKAGAQMAAAG